MPRKPPSNAPRTGIRGLLAAAACLPLALSAGSAHATGPYEAFFAIEGDLRDADGFGFVFDLDRQVSVADSIGGQSNQYSLRSFGGNGGTSITGANYHFDGFDPRLALFEDGANFAQNDDNIGLDPFLSWFSPALTDLYGAFPEHASSLAGNTRYDVNLTYAKGALSPAPGRETRFALDFVIPGDSGVEVSSFTSDPPFGVGLRGQVDRLTIGTNGPAVFGPDAPPTYVHTIESIVDIDTDVTVGATGVGQLTIDDADLSLTSLHIGATVNGVVTGVGRVILDSGQSVFVFEEFVVASGSELVFREGAYSGTNTDVYGRLLGTSLSTSITAGFNIRDGGVVDPGRSNDTTAPVAGPGSLFMSFISFDSGSTLEIDVFGGGPGGTDADFFAADAVIIDPGATLALTPVNPALIERYDSQVVVGTLGLLNTVFDRVTGMTISSTESLAVTYDGTAVFVTAALNADGNLDRSVDLLDFDILANNFGQSGTWVDGDWNGDGVVNLLDFDLVANNFGSSSPSQVPEPASLGLLALGGVMALRRRR
ncbi:MAG: PEP-CTERM sorting domain-containing protein [Planctomycetota bacterium]